MTWFRRSTRKATQSEKRQVAEGSVEGVADASDAVATGLLRMSDRCQRLVAQEKPLGPDESEYARGGYTNAQVYAMMAGTQSAADILGPDLGLDAAQGLANAMRPLGASATAERAMYFYIGALAYLDKQYGVKPSGGSLPQV